MLPREVVPKGPSAHPAAGLTQVAAVGALVLVLMAMARPAWGLSRRDDVPDSNYIALGASYPSVGCVLLAGSPFASGVLVSPNYYITAGHVAFNRSPSLSLNGTTYTAAWSQVPTAYTGYAATDMNWDIGIVRLNTPVTGITPSPLYAGTDEVDKVATLVGYGKPGTGSAGEDTAGTIGTKRAGGNLIERDGTHLNTLFGSTIYTNQTLLLDFDNGTPPLNTLRGSTVRQPMECISTSGDSGGAVFIDVAGTPTLAAVLTTRFVPDSRPASGYGTVSASARISSFLSWIQETLSAGVYWNTGSGLFNTGSNWILTGSEGVTHSNFVPNAYDRIVFNRAETLAVTWPGTAVSNAGLTVADGNVTFDLNSTTYAVGGGAGGGVVIGNTAGKSPRLAITHGTLQTDTVTLGAVGGAAGTLAVGPGGNVSAKNYGVVGAGSIDVTGAETLTIPWDGGVTLAAGAVLTKDGAGTLIVEGTQVYGTGAVLSILDGTVYLNSDAGSATSANLMLDVAGGVVYFGCDQHLETLHIGNAGKVVLGGAWVAVTGHLIIGDFDLGPMMLTPEPATLGLLALGGLAALARRRR